MLEVYFKIIEIPIIEGVEGFITEINKEHYLCISESLTIEQKDKLIREMLARYEQKEAS